MVIEMKLVLFFKNEILNGNGNCVIITCIIPINWEKCRIMHLAVVIAPGPSFTVQSLIAAKRVLWLVSIFSSALLINLSVCQLLTAF